MTQLSETAALIWHAAAATVERAGPLPEHPKDIAAHAAEWCRLICAQDSRLRTLTDAQINSILNEDLFAP